MAVGLHVKSSAEVPSSVDVAGLVVAAGGDPKNARYDNGILTIRGVTQESLDAAVSAGSDVLFGEKSLKVSALDQELNKRREEGMPWAGKILQIHEEALSDINRMVTAAMAGLLPSGFAWRMKDNTFHPVDSNEMMSMGAAAMQRTYALYAHYWSVKDAIKSEQDEDALNAIDVAAGWPAPTTT